MTTDDKLIAAAREAFERSYAPYSKFYVGSAILGASGKVYKGCNVENASFGGTICAERSAVSAMVGDGETRIVKVAVFTDHHHPPPPCGICRQVMREFGIDIKVISETLAGDRQIWTLEELLPDSFGPADLGVDED